MVNQVFCSGRNFDSRGLAAASGSLLMGLAALAFGDPVAAFDAQRLDDREKNRCAGIARSGNFDLLTPWRNVFSV